MHCGVSEVRLSTGEAGLMLLYTQMIFLFLDFKKSVVSLGNLGFSSCLLFTI